MKVNRFVICALHMPFKVCLQHLQQVLYSILVKPQPNGAKFLQQFLSDLYASINHLQSNYTLISCQGSPVSSSYMKDVIQMHASKNEAHYYTLVGVDIHRDSEAVPPSKD